MIHILDYTLFIIMLIATIISFYMTAIRLISGHHYASYDSWMFGMCFALTVTIYDYIYKH
jgi:hypothetical protein